MADEWDSYFHNLSPLSSGSRTLRETSQSEESLSQDVESIIEDHDFSTAVVSHEASTTNSDFDANYYSNPSIGNSNPDCDYEGYYRETPWQGDGEQAVKEHLSKCGDNDIPDFAMNGLSSDGTFPSSFSTDLQGLKQDSEMLTTSFLESYSDVSSCSDADINETRPSCKFMTSNSDSKPKTDDAKKHRSSEWLFTDPGNMTFSPEIGILPGSSNGKGRENLTKCEQDKVKCEEKIVRSYAEHDQPSTTLNPVLTTECDPGGDCNDSAGCQDQEQKDNKGRDLTRGKHSTISVSGHEKVTGCGMEENLDNSEEQHITEMASDIITTCDTKHVYLDRGVQKGEKKESCQTENEDFHNPKSSENPNRKTRQDKNEDLSGGQKESGSQENETIEQKTPKPKSRDGLYKTIETDRQKREIQSNTPQVLDLAGIKLSHYQDTVCGLRQLTSTIKGNNEDTSCSQLFGHQSSEAIDQSNIIHTPAVMSDGQCSDANDEQNFVRHSESGAQANGSHTGENPCLVKGSTSEAERINIIPSPHAACSGLGITRDSFSINSTDKNKQNLVNSTDPNNPRTNVKLPFKKKPTSPGETTKASKYPDGSDSALTSDSNEQRVANNLEICLQLDCSSADTNPCAEKGLTSTQDGKKSVSSEVLGCGTSVTSDTPINASDGTEEKETISCEDSEHCSAALTSDSPTDASYIKEQRISNNLKVYLEPCNSSQDIHRCLEKHWTTPSESRVLSGYVAENASVSFEETSVCKEEQVMRGMLYGEPLSREDSCDIDETNHDTDQYEETSVGRPNMMSMNNSEGQGTPLKSSSQMRKRLQPVVILIKLESANEINNSYHCTSCKHRAHSVDRLIEHQHFYHSVDNFQFCKTCNLFLMKNELTEKHLCTLTPESTRLSCGTELKKRKHRKSRKCKKCALVFPKLIQYVKHMRTHTGKTPYKCYECGLYFAQNSTLRRHKRVPGRCKIPKLEGPEAESSDATKEAIMLPQKDLQVQSVPPANLPECFVKLIDVTKTHICSFCCKHFPTAEKAKKHFYNVHKGKSSTLSFNHSAIKVSSLKSRKEDDTEGRYQCPLCPRLFKYSYNRARHLRDCVRDKISNGKEKIGSKYRCPLCSTTFTLASNRYRHLKTSCLKESLNQLAKERAESRQKVEQEKTKEIEQKKQSVENQQKKQEGPTSTGHIPIPRYKCNLCPAVFCHASGKYRHMKKHELFKVTGKMFRYRNSIFSTMSKLTALTSTKAEESEQNLKPNEAESGISLSCHFCGKCFGASQSLKKHERSHKGERPYRCLECGKGFKKRAYLIGHKIVHKRRIQCTVCRKILPSIGDLIQHSRLHHKRGKLQCPDCPMQFQYPAHLLRHLDTHKNRESKAHHLEEGPQQSVESAKEQSEPKQLQCSLCKEVFDNAQLLRKHCLTHISGSLACPFCKQNFSSRRYLLRHMIKHTGDKSFSCTHCGKQFYRDLYLKLHQEKCLPGQIGHLVAKKSDTQPKRPYKCSFCPRAFCKKIRLKNHHRGHKLNNLVVCSNCGQYYGLWKLSHHQKDCGGMQDANSDSLSLNGSFHKSTPLLRQKTDKMPSQSNTAKMLQFKCSHCPQRFRYRSLLLRHLVSHTGVQPYACMHCGHRYRSQSMCLQHEAFCNGVKEGQSKRASDAATKLANMPTLREAAQKPQQDAEAEYKCRFCTKTFMKSRNLRRHILTHNEVKPYRCKACDSCFSRYDYLKVHQARCKGKRQRLEVCIPKISLEDVGRGWQNKFGNEPSAKQEQKMFQCEVCSRSFQTQSKLSRHFTMFHATKLFKCTRCSSSFSHEKSLKKHRKMKKCRKVQDVAAADLPPENSATENVTKPLQVGRSRVLQRIQPYFNKKYKYVCSYCPRAFGNTWQLCVHTRLHTGEKPYVCDHCDQRFIRKDYLQRHFAKCTRKHEQTIVICDTCGGCFPKSKLETHKKVCTSTPSLSKSTVSQSQQTAGQSPTKGFSCAYCSSRFSLFSQLQEHFLDVHKLETIVPPVSTAPLQQHLSNIPSIKEEPLDNNCDQQLSDGANLICKLDTSLEQEVSKRYVCPECNMSFTNKAGLTGHLRIHSTEHPFNCKTCKKGFWNKNLLRNHSRKCRFGHMSAANSSQQLDVPLKAEIDLALTNSVIVFKDSSKTTGTGVLQTNFSCKDDLADNAQEDSDESQVNSSSTEEKKVVQYQCSECEMSFTDGLVLISHLEDHGREEQEKKRNTCTRCGRVCTSQGNLERHMRIHGVFKKFSCPDCPIRFFTLSDLEIHRTCHDPNRPFACKLCQHRFWTRPSLCNHYSEEHPNDVYTCRFCNKTYSVKKSLARHYKKWHQNEQKESEKSGQETSSIEQQSSNQVSVTAESEEDENIGSEDSDSDSAPYFPCHVCGKTFPTSESLEDHQRCHLGEKPHECAECGRCFFQASQLEQHQRMHKSEFQCQVCGRGFVSLFALRKHKHTHGKNRPHRCSKCHLSFTGPSQLAEHMSTHREENFPCDICNRVFPSKSSRAEHRKDHSVSVKRPPPSVSSEECEKSASVSDSSSAQTKELKYRCGVCNDRFRDPEELSEHGCMAAKERPYSCSDCEKHFLHSSHLKKHRTTHQAKLYDREYPCNQCNNVYSSSENFLGHLRDHDDVTAAENKYGSKSKARGPSHGFICPICHRCLPSAAELIFHFPKHFGHAFDSKMAHSKCKLKEQGPSRTTLASGFECTDCGLSFKGSDACRQHLCSRQQQSVTKPKYSNPSVKTSPPTSRVDAVEEEEVDVTGEEHYNCPVCSMQFSSKILQLEHQNKMHQREKPFKCKVCGKPFALRRYLREHERRHHQIGLPHDPAKLSKEKLKCTQCSSEFSTGQELSLHMRMHAEKEVGKHRCDMCYKSFNQWSRLKQHQESHVGQVVYECTECDKAFAFPHLLEEHQQTHAWSSQ